MQHVILEQTPATTLGRKFIAALPAIFVVLLLLGLVQPKSDPVRHDDPVRQTLKQVSPIADAQARVALESALLLDLPSDPALIGDEPDTHPTPPLAPTLGNTPEPAAQPATSADELNASAPRVPWETLQVREGDSLSSLLTAAGIRAQDWLELAKLQGDAKALRRMKPGEELGIQRDNDVLLGLRYALNPLQSLEISRDDSERWQQQLLDTPHEIERRTLSGQINDSLYLTAREMGLSDRLVMQLVDIYAWDVDFEREVRKGDRLHVIYSQAVDSKTGEDLGKPNIVAVSFEQSRTTRQAFYYEPEGAPAGFFDAEGRPMKKAFLRTPVNFTRISSRFSNARRHPVLNKVRAHRGVDYAAGRGTPILATGAGQVVHAGTKGGYGRTVIIQHGHNYKTLYAHMSRYGSGIRTGTRVKQGQVIGYVGSSGLATGPHLHYEFHKHGQHVDPLSVRLPAADPLPKAELALFQERTAEMAQQLAMLSAGQTVAQAKISATP